jgi:hypothetical protein
MSTLSLRGPFEKELKPPGRTFKCLIIYIRAEDIYKNVK